jgi:hypothetical protein
VVKSILCFRHLLVCDGVRSAYDDIGSAVPEVTSNKASTSTKSASSTKATHNTRTEISESPLSESNIDLPLIMGVSVEILVFIILVIAVVILLLTKRKKGLET